MLLIGFAGLGAATQARRLRKRLSS
ncbi:hypothetical protein [Bradyrhizobium sp. CCBAU 051011]